MCETRKDRQRAKEGKIAAEIGPLNIRLLFLLQTKSPRNKVNNQKQSRVSKLLHANVIRPLFSPGPSVHIFPVHQAKGCKRDANGERERGRGDFYFFLWSKENFFFFLFPFFVFATAYIENFSCLS